jgi:hypothetical protein
MDNPRGEARILTCPFCSETELRAFGRNSLRCDECGGVIGGALLETLYRIVALPDAPGGHACECGHPEDFTNNRRLAKWEGPTDRLDYYRGHRAGHEARLRKTRFVEAS